jgi:broad specificity phosphatase PhoE
VPLNGAGRAQAMLAGRYLHDSFNPAAVWSSDLARCAETATATGWDVQTTPLLREISYGSFEGKTWDEVPQNDRDAAEAAGLDPHFRPPGGESRADLVARAAKFFEETGLLTVAGDIVIVGHGGAMAAMVVYILQLPLTATYQFYFQNASISTVQIDPGPISLTSLSEVSHLRSLERA